MFKISRTESNNCVTIRLTQSGTNKVNILQRYIFRQIDDGGNARKYVILTEFCNAGSAKDLAKLWRLHGNIKIVEDKEEIEEDSMFHCE